MKNKSLLIAIFIMFFSISTVFAANTSLIDTTRKGSLKITALSQQNGEELNIELKGVKYTLYKVDDVNGTQVTTTQQAEDKLPTLTPVAEKVTGIDGVAQFTDLELGRYYAKVTEVPTGTAQQPESFLVDIPMTNLRGDNWEYDIVVQPKVKTAVGTVSLVKTDLSGNPMKNAEYKVQISTQRDIWNDYILEGETEAVTLTTNNNGQLTLENLPISYNGSTAIYRLVETKSDEGYIIDNSHLDIIRIDVDGNAIITNGRTGVESDPAKNATINAVNEKPNISKKVKGSLDVASFNITDTIPFTLTVDIPTVISDMSTFIVRDTLSKGLTNRSNIVLKGLTSTGEETVPDTAYTINENGKILTITFVPAQLQNYTTVVVTYDTKFDPQNVIIGEDGNTNNVELVYTNNVEIDGTEKTTFTTTDTSKVVTGGLRIHKVDSSNNAISGAKFKIATNENNARSGTFIKDETGTDIEVTSGANGYATINGLAYNDDESEREYWLVETQAPTFEDNGEVKAYTLLGAPKRVMVSGKTHTIDITVVNRKPFALPLTGGFGAIILIVAGLSILIIAKSIKREKVQD